MNRWFSLLVLAALSLGRSHGADAVFQEVYAAKFGETALGRLPAGWRDVVNYRPMRNWSVDGNGLLRVTWKDYLGYPERGERLRRVGILQESALNYLQGIVVYEGALANQADPMNLTDVEIVTTLRKTPDRDVFGGLLARVRDRDNYYALEFSGGNVLRLVKVQDNRREILATLVARDRLSETESWSMSFRAFGDMLTGRIFDGRGVEQARVDALNDALPSGAVGLTATTFAAFEDFSIALPGAKVEWTRSAIDQKNLAAVRARQEIDYPVVRAEKDPASLNTPFDSIRDSYDVVIAGAGTSGASAALQAARMGVSVLLLEESDYVGGQMGNAGVTSMDEGGIGGKMPVRERGIYREFHESAINHYYTLNKDPYTAYHFNPQAKGGYEPHVARAILYGLIAETRARQLADGRKPVLDLAIRTKVAAVQKTGPLVTGVELQHWTESGPQTRAVKSKVLVDATEYGDVLPLAGVPYRVGNIRSDAMNLAAPLQAFTWPGVIKEYPEGIPPALKIPAPPPGYEQMVSRFKNYKLYGAARILQDIKVPPGQKAILYWYYVSWRGMPDSTSPSTGQVTEERHTKCGLIGGNDFEVTAATVETPVQRAVDEAIGINKTLGIIYWFQNELGLPWSVADDEPYDTAYNLQRMKERGIREDLLPIAARLPQWPYARESRRMIGLETLRGQDLYTRDREDESCRHWAGAVSVHDYGFDLHGTEDQLELDLDELDYQSSRGPFQIPFGVFIPETVDGFLPAEKNFSQSRLVNGATRLQPSTMLTGQAVGAIAATAVQQGLQPRQVNIIDVQAALLADGDTLMSRWYKDIAWGTPLWQATQLLALYGMMDRPGPMHSQGLLGDTAQWDVGEPVTPAEASSTLAQLKRVVPDAGTIPGNLTQKTKTRAEFALEVADILRKHGKYLVTDAAPYAPPHVLPESKEKKGDKKAKKKKKAEESAEENS